MQPVEIGDILLEPDENRLRITIAEDQASTTLTTEGAYAVIGCLLAWITAVAEKHRP